MDKLLDEMFTRERWEKAIQIAIDKNMKHEELEKYCNPELLDGLKKMILLDAYDIGMPHQQAILNQAYKVTAISNEYLLAD